LRLSFVRRGLVVGHKDIVAQIEMLGLTTGLDPDQPGWNVWQEPGDYPLRLFCRAWCPVCPHHDHVKQVVLTLEEVPVITAPTAIGIFCGGHRKQWLTPLECRGSRQTDHLANTNRLSYPAKNLVAPLLVGARWAHKNPVSSLEALAEWVGFEPTTRFTEYELSRPAP
jgi:hypothetical protein